jgi:hypothetical protein
LFLTKQKEMACYALELVAECDAPMLLSVEAAYVLSIHPTERFERLHGVARRTYVQRNRTFRVCDKGCVGATNQDLTHAYVTLFGSIGEEGSVLVFEDDATLASTARADFGSIDAFIGERAFSTYSLGSIGITVPAGGGHRRYILFGGLTHAVVYSASARAHIRGVDPCAVAHIDMSVIRTMPSNYTFHRAVAVQRLGETENSKTWCVTCDGSRLDGLLRRAVRGVIRLVGLDVDPGAGFRILYRFQRLEVLCLLVLLLLAGIVCIVRAARM